MKERTIRISYLKVTTITCRWKKVQKGSGQCEIVLITTSDIIVSFPGPPSFLLQATKSWAGPEYEANDISISVVAERKYDLGVWRARCREAADYPREASACEGQKLGG